MTRLRLEDLDVPPTHGGTAPNLERRTLGPHTEAWHVILYRDRFMPHQRIIADVAGELDDAGHRAYDLVVVSIMRQEGKTQWSFADLVASTRRRPDRAAVYGSQDRNAARAKVIDELVDKVLVSNVFLKDRFKARRSNGSEAVRWTDPAAARSQIVLASSNDTSGHGLTKIDDVVIDEAWAHRDMAIISGLLPTTTVAIDPQTKILSTVGDGTDGLLLHYEEVGAASLLDPDTTVAYFKWAADPDADMSNPATWWATMPALGRSTTEARIRSFQRTMPAAEFERAFGNRRPSTASKADVDVEAWARAEHTPDQATDDLVGEVLTPRPPWTVAVDIAIDRTAASIAVVGPVTIDGRHRLAIAVDRRPGTAWLLDELLRLAGLGTVEAFYGDRRAGAGGIIDATGARGLGIQEVKADDVVSFTGTFVDELSIDNLAHAGQPVLTDAVVVARKRPIGDAFAWAKLLSVDETGNVVDISPLVAAATAVGAHRRLFPAGYVHQRIV